MSDVCESPIDVQIVNRMIWVEVQYAKPDDRGRLEAVSVHLSIPIVPIAGDAIMIDGKPHVVRVREFRADTDAQTGYPVLVCYDKWSVDGPKFKERAIIKGMVY